MTLHLDHDALAVERARSDEALVPGRESAADALTHTPHPRAVRDVEGRQGEVVLRYHAGKRGKEMGRECL